MARSKINWLKEEVDTAVNILVTFKEPEKCEFVLFQTEHAIEQHPGKDDFFKGKYGMHIIPGSLWIIHVPRTDENSFRHVQIERDNSIVVAIQPEQASPYDYKKIPYGMAQDIKEYMPKVDTHLINYWVGCTLQEIDRKVV